MVNVLIIINLEFSSLKKEYLKDKDKIPMFEMSYVTYPQIGDDIEIFGYMYRVKGRELLSDGRIKIIIEIHHNLIDELYNLVIEYLNKK